MSNSALGVGSSQGGTSTVVTAPEPWSFCFCVGYFFPRSLILKAGAKCQFDLMAHAAGAVCSWRAGWVRGCGADWFADSCRTTFDGKSVNDACDLPPGTAASDRTRTIAVRIRLVGCRSYPFRVATTFGRKRTETAFDLG